MLESGVEVFTAAAQSLLAPQQRTFLGLLLGGGTALLFGFWAAGRLMRRLPAGPGETPAPTPAERAGVTAASREAIEAMLRAEGVVEPAFAARLTQAVDTLARLRTRLAETSPAALEAVDRGDFAEARAILREGTQAGAGVADRAQAEVDARRLTAAGVIDEIKLDYRGAAENFDAAATLVSQIGADVAAEQEWRLRMEQARALIGDATFKGNRESIAPAIAVYDKALSLAPRAAAPHAWAQTQLRRGDALLAADEPHLVEDAVHSYKAALEEWTQRSAPFEWARAQHNLGEALRTLAESDGGVERLQPAADAYRAALKAWTREAAPDLWALAQGNLGDVLAMIGARTGDVAKLREAVSLYQAALGEMRREIAPQEWAQLQNSLGVALEALAEQECRDGDYGQKPLILAVAAFESALEERSAENEPAQFAATSVSLGDSLLALGEHESKTDPDYGAELLGRAIEAYRNGLKAREALEPDDVARIEINLAYALGLMWTRDRDEARLDEALAHVEDAAALLRQGGDPQRLRAAEAARQNILDAKLTQAA